MADSDDASIIQRRSSSESADSISLRINPVILVPGVMGSRLSLSGGPNWDPDSSASMLSMAGTRQRKLATLMNVSQTPATILNTLTSQAQNDIDNNADLVNLAVKLKRPPPPPPPSRFGRQPGFGTFQFYQQKRGWAGVAWSFYGQILMQLEGNLNKAGSYPVHAFGYDWRQSNRANAALLIARINQVLTQENAQKVVLVTHSMGGLVVRSAMQQQGGISNIEAVVHTMIPADGAVVQYRRFHTGAIGSLDTLPGDPSKSGFAQFFDEVADFVLAQILGTTPLEYAVTQSGLLGPLELLPNNSYPGVFLRAPPDSNGVVLEANTSGSNSMGDVYNAYFQNAPIGIVPKPGDTDPSIPIVFDDPFGLPLGSPTITTVQLPGMAVTAQDVTNLNAGIANARQFHTEIAGVAHPRTALLFGSGTPTDVLFDLAAASGSSSASGAGGASGTSGQGGSRGAGPGPNPPQPTVKSDQGDGTVPTLSARFLGAGDVKRVPAFPVRHSTCFQNATFRKTVENNVRVFTGLLPK